MITNWTDLDTYLGLNGDIDVPRAMMVLQLAEDRCTTVLSPLTAAARAVVLDVATRAYTNAVGIISEGVGAFPVTRSAIGVSLTAANRRELRQIAGRGGAFSVDPTPADAGTTLPVWEQNTTWLNGVPNFDQWEP